MHVIGSTASALALVMAASLAQAQPLPTTTFITLGTNAGPMPNPTRFEPANVLLSGKTTILIDAGDGATAQLAKVHIPLKQIDTIVISHLHFDHTGGLFALLGMRYQLITPGTVTIYGPIGTKRMMDGLVAAMQPESESGLGIPGSPYRAPGSDIRVVELGEGSSVTIGNVRVTSTVNTHYSYPAGSADAARYQSLSFRFDAPDRGIVYTGDTGPSKNVERLAMGADTLVTEIIDPEATIAAVAARGGVLSADTQTMMAQHFREQHLTAHEISLLASRAGVRRVIVTHNALFTDDAGKARAEIASNYKGKVEIANDLDRF